MHHSEGIIEYATLISNLVNVFASLGYQHDLQTVSNMRLALEKLPPDLQMRWNELVTNGHRQDSSLEDFSDWLQAIADAHERRLATASRGSSDAQRPKQRFGQRQGNAGSFAVNTGTQRRKDTPGGGNQGVSNERWST